MAGSGGAKSGPVVTSRYSTLRWVIAVAVVFLGASWWAWRQAPLPDPTAPAESRSLLTWLISPIERNAFLRRPELGEPDLEGLFALRGTGLIWAVGADGLILHSPDEGASWHRQTDIQWELPAGQTSSRSGTSPFGLWGWRVPFVANVHAQATSPAQGAPAATPAPAEIAEAQRLLAGLGLYRGAADGLIGAATAAGIRTFQRNEGLADDGILTPDLLRRMREAASVGFAAQGPPPTQQQVPPPAIPQQPTGVRVVDEADGTAADVRLQGPQPFDPTATAAGAENAGESSPRLYAVTFFDASLGLAVGNTGVILQTTDGGRTWRRTESTTTRPLRAVAFATRERAVAVGDEGTLLLTTDSGASWSAVEVATDAGLRSVAFGTPARGIAVGDSGAILVTADAGATWSRRESGADPLLTSVAFATPNRAVAVGDYTILFTSDGGTTWSLAKLDSPASLELVAFVTATHGIAVGTLDEVMVTTDSGETWASHSPFSLIYALPRAISFSSSERGFAVSDGGLATSGDGGLTWSPLKEAPDLHGVAFTTSDRGVVVGQHGTILSTTNGGESWVPNSGGDEWITSVAFADNGRGVAIDLGPNALTTTDAGRTWSRRETEPFLFLNHVAFATPTRAIAVGDGLLLTDDGGETWTSRDAGVAGALFGVAFADLTSGRGAIVGESGTLLVTNDAGNTWSRAVISEADDLYAVAFATPERAVAAGDAGTVLLTTDGGVTWAARPTQTKLTLYGVAFATPEQGVIVGEAGTVLTTRDGGETWSLLRTPMTDQHLYDVTFPTADRAVAVGTGGTVLLSDDRGETWRPIAYARYPSPLFWILSGGVLVVGLVGARRAWTTGVEPIRVASVADLFASDRPLRKGERDALGLTGIAEGISRFLRNRNTEPPLTIAVTGEWGSGKSSLMGLLHADLRGRGFRPVWFNAWHHQRGEQLLASLYANIRAQGLPSWLTPEGWVFRWRLLNARAHRYWFRLSLTVLVSGFVLTYLLTHEGWTQLADRVGEGGTAALVPLGGGLLALLPPLVAAYRALRAFGVSPTSLLGTLARTADSVGSARPGVRYQFAEEFREVTEALKPRHLVIFIDDLDRCTQEHVLEVLEATNFLVTAGECYIVLGMSRRWVETCVGLAFRDLAAEEPETPVVDPAADPLESASARDERRRFARLYLQKLINIEVPIPRVSEDASAALLTPAERPEPSVLSRAAQSAARAARTAWLALVVVAAAGGAYYLATLMPEIRVEEERRVGETTRTESSPPAQTRALEPTPEPQAGAERAATPFRPGAEDDGVAMRHLLVAAAGAMGVLVLVLVLLMRRARVQTDDSPAFREALRIMRPWIVLGHPTPRLLKRYLNAIRFVAMRDRRQDEPASTLETVLTRAGQRLGLVTRALPIRDDPAPLAEPQLVAFSALHQSGPDWQTDPEWLLDHYTALRDGDFSAVVGHIDSPVMRTRVTNTLAQAVRAFNEMPEFAAWRLFEDPLRDRRAIEALLGRMAGVRIEATGADVVEGPATGQVESL